MDRTQELEEQVRRLSRSIDEIRAEVAGMHGGTGNEPKGSSNRRGFLRMGMVAAAGALGWVAVKAVPAAAATGSYMVLGSGNAAENTTTLKADAAITGTDVVDQVLGVESQNFTQANLNTALGTFSETFNGPLRALGDSTGTVEGFDAWAGGPSAYAVWGLSDGGTGVTGEAITGIGLYARGTGRLRQDPQGTPGSPNYMPNLMEQVRDSDGVLWIHNASATLASWRRVNTVRVDSAANDGTAFVPVRAINTDPGIGAVVGGITGPLHQGNTYSWTLAGTNGIPADAVGIVGNITAIGYTSGGFLTMFPKGATRPVVSSVNFAGTFFAWGNHFTLGFGTGVNAGAISIYIGLNTAPDTCHLTVDVFGYIQ